jgi:hypothetical protein
MFLAGRRVYQRVTERQNISLKLYNQEVILGMPWEVEYTDDFEEWWSGLDADEQVSVAAGHGKMSELRVQHRGRPYRLLYAFDPRRVAVLLLDGTKTGSARWYEKTVPQADLLYDRHLEALKREGDRNA